MTIEVRSRKYVFMCPEQRKPVLRVQRFIRIALLIELIRENQMDDFGRK